MLKVDRIDPGKRYSKAVVYNGMIFVTGQTADDFGQDIRSQTRDTLAKIDEVLATAGSNKSRLLSAQIWLKNISRDFEAMNEVWESWLSKDPPPARATAQCEMAEEQILVEIIVTAAV